MVIDLWGWFQCIWNPYCYTDGFKLTKRGDSWEWQPLLVLPWPVSSGGMCAIGSTIYLFGGADYDADKFYTETDRTGKIKRLGARLLAFDTANAGAGWKELPECPGAPRFVEAFMVAGGKLYVIGGVTGLPHCTVVTIW